MKQYKAIFYAILAALLYGISSPASKVLLEQIPPVLNAALLYIGAGIGMSVIYYGNKKTVSIKEAKLTKSELPFIIGMVLLDIAAPVFLMYGIAETTASTVSLLNNFEIVATTLIAALIYKEHIGKRFATAIILITLASILLSITDTNHLSFSIGAILVLISSICWGFENNCTRMISGKNPMEIVIIKGFGSGLGALVLFFFMKGDLPVIPITSILSALFLGFLSLGLSIYLYILSQRELGAARTSSYYSFAPFIGVFLSFLILKETPTPFLLIALPIMIAGGYLTVSDKHTHLHRHEAISHDHRHNHKDGHHNHVHDTIITGEHSHVHYHEELVHTHRHTPDINHTHSHSLEHKTKRKPVS